MSIVQSCEGNETVEQGDNEVMPHRVHAQDSHEELPDTAGGFMSEVKDIVLNSPDEHVSSAR